MLRIFIAQLNATKCNKCVHFGMNQRGFKIYKQCLTYLQAIVISMHSTHAAGMVYSIVASHGSGIEGLEYDLAFFVLSKNKQNQNLSRRLLAGNWKLNISKHYRLQKITLLCSIFGYPHSIFFYFLFTFDLIPPYPSGLFHWHWGNHYPGASEATLMDMGNWITWSYY